MIKVSLVERFRLTKASSSVVEVSVCAIFLLKKIGVLIEGLSVVMVGVDSSESEEIADFCNALLPVVTLLVEYRSRHDSSVGVLPMCDDVMLSAPTVVNRLTSHSLGDPRVSRKTIFVVVRLGCHVIEHFLERSVFSWRIKTQVIRWVSREGLVRD